MKTKLSHPFIAFAIALSLAAKGAFGQTAWWSDAVNKSLDAAGTNRPAIQKALEQAPAAQHDAMQFLIANMPESDLKTLTAEYILDDVSSATEAFNQAPWRTQIPTEIFLNDVLPYSAVNETRDNWRHKLHDLAAPIVAGCKTPCEAAQRINEKLYPQVNVKYSTKRKRADQSALETMDSGLASCTGLSILLIDACRSVGIPARLVGTPMWADNRGNHTWVEIWDGRWHFVGAAEPDAKGLDHAWFEHDAAQAIKSSTEHAIYASSYQKTDLPFPMDWAPGVQWVSAENVTDNYTPSGAKDADTNKMRLLVEVLDQLAGHRVVANVTVACITNKDIHFEGKSTSETADKNNLLSFQVPRGMTYLITAEANGEKAGREFISGGSNAQYVAVISLSDTTLFQFPSQMCAMPATPETLQGSDEKKLREALAAFFAAPAEKRSQWKFSRGLEKMLREHEDSVRNIAWEMYKAAPIHSAMKEDFDAHHVRFDKYESPYTIKTVGTRPARGWPLFIAMHGGGGTAKEVNDSQWKIMQIYYKDHPEVGGYKYLALRAPNDTWNGFYDDYVYPLIDNLIREYTLFGDVDPNKVYIMGYSHGGYGAFAIGPKEPDLFAAIHASAGAPTEGETTAKTLRNTVFTCMVGELDTAYGRFDRDKKFRETVRELRGNRTDIYPVNVQIIPGNPHTGLPDRDEILEMYPAVRNTAPRELTWLMTDKVIKDFFWLHADDPAKQKEFDADCHDNHVVVTTTTNFGPAEVYLDSRLVNFDKPIIFEVNGKKTKLKVQPSLRVLCQRLLERGDPDLAFTAEIPLDKVNFK